MITFYKHNEVPKEHRADLGREDAAISANDVLVYLKVQPDDKRQLGMVRNWIAENCPDDSHFINTDWWSMLVIIPMSQAALLRLALQL
jgi:hypothetical protein